MAYEPGKIISVESNVIRIAHPEIPKEPSTYLTAASAALATTFTVADNSHFLDNDAMILGNYGQETTEIVQQNGSPTAGSTLTVDYPVTGAIFAHPVNTPVRKALFNRVEISGASTLTGSKTSITTIDLDISASYTEYVVSGTTYAYYFVRYYNNLATSPYYGDYSDGVASTNFANNTVGFIINAAFETMKERVVADGLLSRRWAYRQIYLGELDVAKRLKRWSWLQSFDYDAGNLTEGQDSFVLPTDIADTKSPKDILSIRLGGEAPMSYISKSQYEWLTRDVHKTTVDTTFTAAATTIILTNSRDFTDSGTIRIGSDSIDYTGNTRSTNTLTGVTGIVAGGHTAGDQVWQNATFGIPRRYTLSGGSAVFEHPLDSQLEGRNVWMDYYTKITQVDSDNDTLSVTDPFVIQLWLEMQIKKQKNGGELAMNDNTRLDYETHVARLIGNEVSGQQTLLIPDIDDPSDDYVTNSQNYGNP